jgi:uncharacterized protein YndB with AHSA1/START domain
MFRMEERPGEWAHVAPIRIERVMELAAPPERVFEVLADLPGWTAWFRNMSKSVLETPPSGPGAVRVVTIGTSTVRERAAVLEPGRLVLSLMASNVPGMRAMTEDWVLEPTGDGHTRLRFTAGVEVVPVLRPFAKPVKAILTRTVSGSDGLVGYIDGRAPTS